MSRLEFIVGIYKQSRWAVRLPRGRQQRIHDVTPILFVITVPELLVYVLVLSAFANSRKSTISFVMSVRLPARMEQLGFHGTDFQEILHISFFFRNQLGKFKFH
jgi:hypothetical protein